MPYTVSSTIIADLLGGRIQATFAPAAFTLPLLQDGRLLALAVAADEPMREPIAVPTALSAEYRLSERDLVRLSGSRQDAPSGAAALHDAIAEVGKDPELQAKIRCKASRRKASGCATSTCTSARTWSGSSRCWRPSRTRNSGLDFSSTATRDC